MTISTHSPGERLLGPLAVRLLRHAWGVVGAAVLLALAFAWLAATRLSVNSDTSSMLSDDLEWRQAQKEYDALFPASPAESILVVVDGQTRALADQAADELADRLEALPAGIERVRRPGADPFFRSHALLYLDRERLDRLADRMALLGPGLTVLRRNPGLPALVELLRLAQRAAGANAAIDAVGLFDLDGLHAALADAADAARQGRFHRLAWETVLSGDAAGPSDRRRVLVVHPSLDLSSLGPSERVIAAIRAQADQLGLTEARGVRVRVTGEAAMANDEYKSAAGGAWLASGVALIGVSAVLLLGLGSVRLAVASVVALLVGLSGTAAFAAAAIGTLNLISVAFAVLYIGLGIDYAIHFCLRYREAMLRGMSHPHAVVRAARDIGPALAICAVTTSIGFFAFVPTDFTGVSELGIIAGVGMYVSLAANIIVLPALVGALGPPRRFRARRPRSRVAYELIETPEHHRVLARVVAVLAAGVGLWLAPHVAFDPNRMNLRDPTLESVRTYYDLLSDRDNPPLTVSVLAGDDEEAALLRRRLEALPTVRAVATLDSFVPEDQDARLRAIARLGAALEAPRAARPAGAATTPDARRDALGALAADLRGLDPGEHPGAGRLGGSIQDLLSHLETLGPEAAAQRLLDLETSVLEPLDGLLATLGRSLDAGPIERATLPASLAAEWIASDGRPRLEIIPAIDVADDAELARFVAEVREAAPMAVGGPVGQTLAGGVIAGAFVQAIGVALVLVTVLVAVLLRSVRSALLCITPLLIAGLLLGAVSVALDLPFNFANIIALPLMLGVGVDSGIHMVHRWQVGRADEEILQTSTARAVLFSSLTTIASFGALTLADHRGMASMGTLLAIGIFLTMACTLWLLPALLPRRRPAG